MKIAIISDVHGNLEALRAVIEDIDQRNVDCVVCLGDNIGYGPDAEGVTQLLRCSGFLSVLGNHERALFDLETFNSLNFQTQDNNVQIRAMLSGESLDYYKKLPLFIQIEDMFFVHGFPPDSVIDYLFAVEEEDLEKYFQTTENYVCFVGHTHRLGLVSWDGSRSVSEKLLEGKHFLKKDYHYLVNAGSVGQPRDKNNMAKYLIWDNERRELEVKFVPYDAEPTIAKIGQLGFPNAYAMRLK